MYKGIIQLAIRSFQFHYGTIKRWLDDYKYYDKNIHFNSIMVRLKENERYEKYLQVISFQFHYGTIKSPRCYLFSSVLAQFQFPYGTITR